MTNAVNVEDSDLGQLQEALSGLSHEHARSKEAAAFSLYDFASSWLQNIDPLEVQVPSRAFMYIRPPRMSGTPLHLLPVSRICLWPLARVPSFARVSPPCCSCRLHCNHHRHVHCSHHSLHTEYTLRARIALVLAHVELAGSVGVSAMSHTRSVLRCCGSIAMAVADSLYLTHFGYIAVAVLLWLRGQPRTSCRDSAPLHL